MVVKMKESEVHLGPLLFMWIITGFVESKPKLFS